MYFKNSGYYRVKVIPNQPKTELRGQMDDGTIKIAVISAPERGKANKELLAFISKLAGVPKQNISITSGLTSRLKVISIEKHD